MMEQLHHLLVMLQFLLQLALIQAMQGPLHLLHWHLQVLMHLLQWHLQGLLQGAFHHYLLQHKGRLQIKEQGMDSLLQELQRVAPGSSRLQIQKTYLNGAGVLEC